MTTAVVYARTSTDRQERDETIQSQLDACETYANANGLSLVDRFVDDGISGSQLQRPGLSRLRDAARARAVGTLVVYDIDRLSRNLGHLLFLMEEFAKAEVDVRFIRSPLEDSPEGRVLFNIKGVFAEYEREKIRERTLRGKVRYIKDGGWFGVAPYGYRVVDQHLAVDEAEARWLRELFRRYADGGSTLNSLSRYLDECGVPTRKHGNLRRGWDPSIIARILQKELYTGTFRREIKGIPESACKVGVPPLVDETTWARAQARLQLNRAEAQRNRVHFYLLAGIIRCGACGHRYYGKIARGITYYRCQTNMYPGRQDGRPCGTPGVRVDAIEGAVWDKVVELITQPEAILVGRRALLEEAAAEGTAVVEERQFQMRRARGRVDSRKSRVLDLLIDRPQDKDLLTQKLEGLDREAEKLSEQEKVIAEEMKSAATREERLSRVRETFETLRPRLSQLGDEDRRQICRLLIEEIRVRRGREIEVDWLIPTSMDGAERASTSLTLPKRRLSPDQRAARSALNSAIMRRRVEAGAFIAPTKDPAIAKKVSEALLKRVGAGTWKRPPAPGKDPETGRWVKGSVAAHPAVVRAAEHS